MSEGCLHGSYFELAGKRAVTDGGEDGIPRKIHIDIVIIDFIVNFRHGQSAVRITSLPFSDRSCGRRGSSQKERQTLEIMKGSARCE